jgi:hypothetical protein
MGATLFIDGPFAGRWMDFDDLDAVRHPDGTIYERLRAVVPGWRIGLRFYTCRMSPGQPFPAGMELPGYIAGQRFEREPLGERRG